MAPQQSDLVTPKAKWKKGHSENRTLSNTQQQGNRRWMYSEIQQSTSAECTLQIF